MGFETCGPNEVMVVSGLGRSKPTYVIGGWVFVLPKLQRIQRLSLNIITISVESMDVRTAEGIIISAKGVAQVKVFSEVPELLVRAVENFLGKSLEEIGDIVKETLQGHQRSVIVNRKLEDIYFNREETATLVFETAAPDLGRMGICIDGYTIPDVWDGEGHIKALVATRAERMNAKDDSSKD